MLWEREGKNDARNSIKQKKRGSCRCHSCNGASLCCTLLITMQIPAHVNPAKSCYPFRAWWVAFRTGNIITIIFSPSLSVGITCQNFFTVTVSQHHVSPLLLHHHLFTITIWCVIFASVPSSLHHKYQSPYHPQVNKYRVSPSFHYNIKVIIRYNHITPNLTVEFTIMIW